jgi:hypothetical protein
MVITAAPQVEAVQPAGGGAVGGGAAAGGAVAAGGAIEDMYDEDIPPPQALRAAISKAQVMAGNHRRRTTSALVEFCAYCMEFSPMCGSSMRKYQFAALRLP